MAQVTLYGVVDAAVGASSKTAAESGSNYSLANTNTQALANGTLTNGNSRWGMKGTEDLGGGLKSGFVLEGSINLATGANQGSGNLLFSRNAYLTLGGSFGALKVGRQLNPSFLAMAQWDLTGTANYSVAMNQFGGALTGFRDNAEITYSTPNMGGFGLSVGVVPQGNAQYGTAADPKGKYDIGASYNAGPVAAGLGYSKVDNGNEATTLGGSYNFGAATVAASWNSLKDGSGNKQREGYTLGVSVPVGPWTFTGDIAQIQTGAALVNGSSSTDYLLEAKYALSKSTFMYAVYVMDGKGVTAVDNSSYAIGLRKNF